MTSRSNSDMWMGASSSDISMPSNALLDLEDDSPWKPPTSSQTNTLVESKDCLGASSFSKGVLEEEWYMAATPETSLMELPYSSPFTLPENRSTFNLLEPPLAFDNTSTLLNSFRTAPTLGLGLESNRILDELACGGQSSFLTNISGSRGSYSNAGRSSPLAMSIENYNANLSSGLNISMLSSNGSSPISNIGSNSHSNFSIGLPSFSDAFASPTLSRGGLNKVTPNGAVPFHANKHPETSLGGSQTLFQKRAASRHNGGSGTLSPLNKSPPRILTSASNDSSVDMPETNNLPSLRKVDHNSGSDELNEMGLDGDEDDGKDDDDLDESGDGSAGAYEVEEGAGNGVGQFDGKGKGKKGLPAKNLMAERRRRKKLNDRLYMLRSVVPKITKMDRASILGDAIEYLKELLQRISDIHNELEEAKMEQSRLVPLSPSALNPRSNPTYQMVKEECPVLPNPESQPPRVEVRKREGQALNIHMFCARRPGLLLSTVRALDALGLDVQQAVISCFNGFALDLFRAEQAKDVDVGPEEIKAVLLLTAGCGN